MKRTIKRLIGHSLFTSRLDRWLLQDAAVIVAFHRVRPSNGSDGLTMDVPEFERYCRFFKHHFRVVPLGELVTLLEHGRPVNRELAITFDDGYQDNFRHAAPILEELSLPATFFVVTQWIGTDIVAWWDEGQPVRHSWMAWDEVKSLHARGFEIGAHTRTHVDLGAVPQAEAREEIHGSRRELEEKLGGPITAFAYPYGRRENITEAARRIVRDAGFDCCCSAFGGINGGGTSPFFLRRIPVTPNCVSPDAFGFDLALGRTLLAA